MLFAQIFALWFPGSETAILLGLAGMATLLAATTHAPIMSALMVCEMTGQYFYFPGFAGCLCCGVGIVEAALRHDSIYGQHTAEKPRDRCSALIRAARRGADKAVRPPAGQALQLLLSTSMISA